MARLSVPMTSYAADDEWRMMHGEQDALVVGTVTEITEEFYEMKQMAVLVGKYVEKVIIRGVE